MKNLKKIVLTLMALVMALTMVTAVAESEPTDAGTSATQTGSITINGASADNTYEIYQMLDLESYNTTSGAYAYKVNSSWTGLFTTDAIKDYMAVDADGYVTWVGSNDAETVVAFARSALAYAEDNDIAPVKSSKVAGDFVMGETAGVFSNLPLGYYLVDSTMGALCGLTTTNPDAKINAKNGQPSIDKTVQEDSTSQWGDSNTADIGQEVFFRTTISVHDGAQNYVLHDTMSPGLTFQGVSKIEHVIPEVKTTEVEAKYYTVATEGLKDDCTFEVIFTNEFCDHLETNDKVIIYYSAVLNKNAVVAGDGNDNSTQLDFGENHTTTTDSTKTKTFGFDIIKTDGQNTLIDGAEFKIYDNNDNEVLVVKVEDGLYRRAIEGEPGENIVVTNGEARVIGFDNGTYFLEETKAPDGYNKLSSRQKFIIADNNLDAIFNDGIYSSGSGVQVINKSGTMLPETGGIGTTIFYVCGGLLVGAAVVLLITRKRMTA